MALPLGNCIDTMLRGGQAACIELRCRGKEWAIGGMDLGKVELYLPHGGHVLGTGSQGSAAVQVSEGRG